MPPWERGARRWGAGVGAGKLLIPADAGSHIGIAELFLQDGTHPPEDNIPGAVAERIVDAPEIVDVHDAEEKGPILQPKPASAF